jgi:hypothetical protein
MYIMFKNKLSPKLNLKRENTSFVQISTVFRFSAAAIDTGTLLKQEIPS